MCNDQGERGGEEKEKARTKALGSKKGKENPMFRRGQARRGTSRSDGGHAHPPPTAQPTQLPPPQPNLAQRLGQGATKIVNGLSTMLGSWKGMRSVNFTDEAFVATTGGSFAHGKTTLIAEGDPQAMAELQRELTAVQNQLTAAHAEADNAQRIAQLEAQLEVAQHRQ